MTKQKCTYSSHCLRLIYDGFCISFVYRRVILSFGAISYEAQVDIQTKMYISIALLRTNHNEFQLIKLAQQTTSTYLQLFSKISLHCRTTYSINLCYQYQTIAVFQQVATKFLLVEKAAPQLLKTQIITKMKNSENNNKNEEL